jgi:hypothetical protein
MDSELVPTPAEVMAKATKMLQRVMLLQVVWFLCFVAGGLATIWTAWKNTHLPAACTAHLVPGAASGAIAGCSHHSYHWPVLLVLVGVVGLLVTGYVATRLAVKYLGAGAAAFLRSGRRFVGPMGPRTGGQGMGGPRTGGQGMGGGFPGSSGGMPPGLGAGLPPGTPESRSGPPRG